MGFVSDFVGGIFGGGDDAADAAKDASRMQADYQQRGLDYLMETEEIPQQLREENLTALGQYYGQDPGAFMADRESQIFGGIQDNPLYQQTLQAGEYGKGRGEEAIMRNAAMTGGLRSGNVNRNLYEYNRDFDTQLQNQAFMNAYGDQSRGYGERLGGMSSLAQLPSNAQAIANQTSNIGQTLAQGEIGAAQNQQAGLGAGISNIGGLASLGSSAWGAMGGSAGIGSALTGLMGMFSDRRLKTNVTKIGEKNGLNLYSWDWNETAETLGLTGSSTGVMADEVEEIYPEAVDNSKGFKTVNYDMIGVN